VSRWRPPPPRSSPYITAGGKRRLQAELQELWVRRREVTAAVTAAAAEGDRSENAEYIYRKKQLREIDRRLRYLQKRLDVVRVAGDSPGDPARIYFGARVRLLEEDGSEVAYRIVGADEIDAGRGFISVDSPVARAMLGKSIEGLILVPTPEGQRRLRVLAIDYPDA